MASITTTINFFEAVPRPTKTYRSASYDRISTRHGFNGTGKTILITGGSSGIGLNIAKAFAGAGVARIAILSRSRATQLTAKAELEAAYPSTSILLYEASVTDADRFASVLEELADVDVLVLCAAAVHARVSLVELSGNDVQHVFDSNSVSTVNLARLYIASAGTPGRDKTILHVSSAAAQMCAPLRSVYGASKAAAVQAMQHLARENEGTGHRVRVFSFHPGAITTPGSAAVYTSGAVQWEDADLPAHFSLWLAGPESDFLNGRYVWANWDVDELVALKERLARDDRFLTIGLIL
ncbi:hypothetical protein E4U17_005871 [Claviceps sp. LM77 group G4]|nr:hypothetical protein E4U17_005871 [Claviceps sp. LM77 group G4]KAG6067981.1 hypothetical protein E4U33_005151 [Claviceps sp. LM78 group G4]KAG6081032.1 hypothetical protein E4U16_007917 [Claviceps sp. LM84 group G4]